MWGTERSPRELFDAVAAAEITDHLAESAYSMVDDWNGNPFNPPLSEQPGVYAWGEAHLQLAYVTQFEATGETRYLDTFLERFHRLLALRDDRTGRRDVLRDRIMPAWGSVFFTGNRYSCFIVHAGMLTYPAARALRAIFRDPALSTRYADVFTALRDALCETMAAFDHEWHDGPEDGEGYYTDAALDGRHLPVNQQNCLGRTMLLLAEVTGRGAYRTRVEQLARFLRRRLTVTLEDAYCWVYHPPVEPPFPFTPGEDMSHGSMNVDFAALCHQHGVVFSDEDMRRFSRTLLRVIRRGPGRYAELVDGTGEENRYADVLAYWGHLARTCPEVASELREHYLHREPPLHGPMALVALAMLSTYAA